MRGIKSKRTLLVASAIILLCMTLIVGATYALFTDTQTVKNHLQAGNLSITLKRIELTKTHLDDMGYLFEDVVQTTDDPAVTFSNPTDKNMFDIETDEKIVPGSKYAATLQIENHSDVAFRYWIEIVCRNKSQGEDLAKQLKVTVNTGDDASAFVNDGLIVKGDGGYVGELAIGDTENFTVTVEFLDSFVEENDIDHNDLAQGEKVEFDLVVHAVQATTASTTP